ncbi:hypothetical protein Tco_1270353 [Tanacetum coccineum]
MKKILSSATPKTLQVIRESSPPTQVADTKPSKELVATADVTKSLSASELAEELRNQSSTADATKAENIVEEEHDEATDSRFKSLGNVTFKEMNLNTEDIPFDIEYEIKSLHTDGVEITMVESSRDAESDEIAVDIVLEVLADLANSKNASADKPSLSDLLGHIQAEVSSLTTKVKQLESSLAKKVADKLEESIPRMVADAFEERMPELLSDTLKNILPYIIKKSIQQALPKFDQMVQETLKAHVPELISKPLNKELNALNTLESRRFDTLQKELMTTTRAKVGNTVRKSVGKEMHIVRDRISYCVTQLNKGDVNHRELINLMKDMIFLLDLASVFDKAKVKREKVSTQEDRDPELSDPTPTQREPQPTNTATKPKIAEEAKAEAQEEQSAEQAPTTDQVPLVSTNMVVQSSEEKTSEEKPTENEPPLKRLRILASDPNIPSPTSLISIMPQGINPFISINISLDQFTKTLFNTTSFKAVGEGQMTLDEAKAQMQEIQRLAFLKAEKEKSEKKLKVLTPAQIYAQAWKLAEFEAKRAKILEEYYYYITHRADLLLIIKISYKINNSTKEAFMWITRDSDPLNLIVYDKFVLKTLGFSEWLEIHVLASKVKTAEKKRKRTFEIIKEVFVSEDIVVDGMHRNLVPPPGVAGSRGLVIREPESGFFFYNGNFNLVFQREEEFHLDTTSQLIRTQSVIQNDIPEAEEMFKKLELTIEARSDVAEARKIVKENLDGLGQYMLSIEGLAECKASTSNEDSLSAKHQRAVKGLAECKASASNLKRIQVKYIVKEVEDYLKTYSSNGMDISWYVEGIR